jgi:hypothetical protein
VTARFIDAIAAHCEVRLVRQSHEQVEQTPLLGGLHLSAIATDKAPPRLVIAQRSTLLQECVAGRELREPDVIEIA